MNTLLGENTRMSLPSGILHCAEVDTSRWICWVSALHKSHESLDGLQILTRCLVVHDVGLTLRVPNVRNFLSSGTLVDTHTGNPNWPRSITDRQLKVHFICVLIIPTFHGLHNTQIKYKCRNRFKAIAEFGFRTTGFIR